MLPLNPSRLSACSETCMQRVRLGRSYEHHHWSTCHYTLKTVRYSRNVNTLRVGLFSIRFQRNKTSTHVCPLPMPLSAGCCDVGRTCANAQQNNKKKMTADQSLDEHLVFSTNPDNELDGNLDTRTGWDCGRLEVARSINRWRKSAWRTCKRTVQKMVAVVLPRQVLSMVQPLVATDTQHTCVFRLSLDEQRQQQGLRLHLGKPASTPAALS